MATIAYRFRIKRVLSDERRIMDEIRSGHRLRNDLVAIERQRRQETREHWARVGGYEHLVTELERLTEETEQRVKELPKGPERRAAWQPVYELRQRIWDIERATSEAHEDPAKVRRKQRAKELLAQAKEEKRKLGKIELARLLDAEPDCVSPRDRMRLEIEAEYKARGVAVSAKKMAQRLRDAGLVGSTEHIEERARRAAYAAYQARGVTPGTRAVVTEAHERSLEKLGLREQRFAPWLGHGSFGVQIRGGATPEELFGGEHTQLQLAKSPDRERSRPGSRRACRWTLLRVRIGSNEKRNPIWAEFSFVRSRQIHPEARVTQAIVTVDREGLHDQWHVVLTANVPDDAYGSAPKDQHGTVAVDVGWRSWEGDLRVGYWADDRGGADEICPPAKDGPRGVVPMRDKLAHARSIQGLLSEKFCTPQPRTVASDAHDATARCVAAMLDFIARLRPVGALNELVEWVRVSGAELPEWLGEETKTLPQWRSQERLSRLVERWLANRFPGDEKIVARLDEWRRNWRHLFEWQARERKSALDARNEHYRLIAARLARSYSVILINSADLAASRRRKPAEKAEELVMIEDRKRSQAFDAAPGELREEIIRAAKKYGATVLGMPFDTETCHACGAKCTFDRARHVHHKCEHCDARWDQDFNACRNALRERSGDGQTPGSARKRGKGKESQRKPPPDASRAGADHAAE